MNLLKFKNALGNEEAKLHIDRTFIDLFPLFKFAFRNVDRMLYDYYSITKELPLKNNFFEEIDKSRWNINDEKAELNFLVEHFFKAFLTKYSVNEVSQFLEQNVDFSIYDNEIMVNRLKKFHHFYERLIFYRGNYGDSNLFAFGLVDSDEPKKIENLIKYKPLKLKRKEKIKSEWYENLKEFTKGKLTSPYNLKYLSKIVNQIEYDSSLSKKIIILPSNITDLPPRLNLFDIVSYYKLPVENLKIVENRNI